MSIKKLISRALTRRHTEHPDPTPMALPVKMQRPPSLQDMFEKYLVAANHMAQNQGFETLDEADDFDVGEDLDPESPYELCFDPTLNKEISKQEKSLLDAHRKDFDHNQLPKLKKKKKFIEEKPVDSPQQK